MDPFFNINELDRKKLLQQLEATTFHFAKNSPILQTIKTDDLFGIVIKGGLQVIRTDYEGRRIIVEELNENDLFGTSISFYDIDECELLTVDDSEIVIIDNDGIKNYLYSDERYYHQFILNLYSICLKIISERNQRISILTQRSIRDKLLKYFDVMSMKYHSRIIYLPFSFTDLADYLAVDRSAMSREIKHLKDERIIEVRGRKIILNYKRTAIDVI